MKAKGTNDFNSVALYYDRLARVVFGKSIVRAQTEFLHHIQSHSNILILGGGSGWILEEISKRTTHCQIWYIDASGKMISMTRKRNTASNKIIFIHGTEKDIPDGMIFDVVITNFYFDMFEEVGVEKQIQLISHFTSATSCWFVADFINTKWWHTILLKIMYAFFKMTANIGTSSLPDWELAFHNNGCSTLDSKVFYAGFIKSCMMTNTSPLQIKV